MKLVISGMACILLAWPALLAAGVVLLPTDMSVTATSQETTQLESGDRITFDLSVTNLGPEVANGLLIRTSPIFDELDVFSASTANCSGDVVLAVADLENSYYYSFGWHPGPLGADIEVAQTLSCELSIDYTSYAPSVFPVTFGFSSYLTDLNPSNNSATVTLHRAPAMVAPLPANSSTGLLSLALLLLASVAMRHAAPSRRAVR